MKRLLLVLLVAFIAIPTFQACKKGANDPAISFKSRKARLCGDWTLKSGSTTVVSGGSSTVYTYTGSTVSSSGGGSANYTEAMSIVKDGTFKYTIMNNGASRVSEGQWYFMDGNKDKKIKDKEVVAFYETTITYTPAGGTASVSTYVGISPDYVWQLDELKSKEIIVLTDESSTSGGSTSTRNGTMTYEKK
ncbi:MAG: hypothetical protein WCL06_05485 [Bacteroidota bacterium]